MEKTYVDDADRAEFQRIFMELLDAHLVRTLPRMDGRPKLYHYTTIDTLIMILESGTLWATQVACMNDSSELLHGIRLLEATAEQRIQSQQSPAANAILKLIKEECADTRTITDAPIYLICFSSANDDLSQWRAYGGNVGGVALVFDAVNLMNARQDGGLLFPVLYSADKKKALMAAIVERSIEMFEAKVRRAGIPEGELAGAAHQYGKEWGYFLGRASPYVKHEGFKSEQEWRMAFGYDHAIDGPSMKFVQRDLMLTRHLPKQLGDRLTADRVSLPLEGILIGPTTHPDLSLIGVKDLMRKNGYDLNQVYVKASDIPFRPIR